VTDWPRQTWLRLRLVLVWSNPESIELLNATALTLWGVLLLLPGGGLAAVPSLAFLAPLLPDELLGWVLLLAAIAQQMACLHRLRPWRALLLLASLGWWTFLGVAVALRFGASPGLGLYGAMVGACFWAALRVRAWERWNGDGPHLGGT
jgi:hypothetical protein